MSTKTPSSADPSGTDPTPVTPASTEPAASTASTEPAADPAATRATDPTAADPAARRSHRARPTRSRRSRITRRALLGGGAAVVVGVGGSTAWAYDRFLREKVEVADVTEGEAQAGVTAVSSTDGTYTATGYTSSTTTLTLSSTSTGTGSETITWYAADIQLTDATVLRSAFAQDKFGQNITEKPTAMASRENAVLAINGDYYGFRDTGIEIRNGVAYRDEPARTGLAFYRDGRVELYDETATSASALVDDGVWNTLSFGPAVLVDGAVPEGIEDMEVDTNVGNHSIQGDQPRTAIGVIGQNHIVLLVVDGRSEGYSKGATLPELGQILADLGCTTGYNLDGGGSSVMIFDGDIVNQPSNGGERGTSDILYVAG